jgi:hypothetical protein
MRSGIIRALLTCAIASFALAPAVTGCGSDDAQAKPEEPDSGSGILDNGDAAPTGFEKCATDTRKAEVVPVDLMVGLDTSFSMDFDKKWISVQAALKTFVKNPALAGLGLGVQYFPLRKQCSVADYAQPAVPITELPAATVPVSSSLDGQQMFGGTPMVPMLQGLNEYMKGFATQHTDRKAVIVVATDGIPDDTCQGGLNGSTPNTIDNAVAAAKASFDGSPSVSVFVIGVGGELTALNAIGQAGGTGNAILVDTTQDVEKAFLDALTTIRKTAIPCDYNIPALNGPPDPSKINVNYVTPTGPTLFLYVATAADCAKAEENGWYFDDPNAPTKVVLCPKTCEKVKSTDDGKIDVVFGCDRQGIK